MNVAQHLAPARWGRRPARPAPCVATGPRWTGPCGRETSSGTGAGGMPCRSSTRRSGRQPPRRGGLAPERRAVVGAGRRSPGPRRRDHGPAQAQGRSAAPRGSQRALGRPEDRHVDGGHTSRERTIVDCMRSLPFDEALAIADSALRAGSFLPDDLVALAALSARSRGGAVPSRGAARRRPRRQPVRVGAPGDRPRRARSRPGTAGRIVGRRLCGPTSSTSTAALVVEADSFAWHGSRGALRRDCRRYNRLVLLGCVVLRFAWEDVMHDRRTSGRRSPMPSRRRPTGTTRRTTQSRLRRGCPSDARAAAS